MWKNGYRILTACQKKDGNLITKKNIFLNLLQNHGQKSVKLDATLFLEKKVFFTTTDQKY